MPTWSKQGFAIGGFRRCLKKNHARGVWFCLRLFRFFLLVCLFCLLVCWLVCLFVGWLVGLLWFYKCFRRSCRDVFQKKHHRFTVFLFGDWVVASVLLLVSPFRKASDVVWLRHCQVIYLFEKRGLLGRILIDHAIFFWKALNHLLGSPLRSSVKNACDLQPCWLKLRRNEADVADFSEIDRSLMLVAVRM